jgi:hypothetical protein
MQKNNQQQERVMETDVKAQLSFLLNPQEQLEKLKWSLMRLEAENKVSCLRIEEMTCDNAALAILVNRLQGELNWYVKANRLMGIKS